MRPDFKNVELKGKPADKSFSAWEKEAGIQKSWKTPEQIPVKPVYGESDLHDMEHLQYAAGLPPFLRGPYSTMFVSSPWTIRQYAGFSTAKASNEFYRKNLAAGLPGTILPCLHLGQQSGSCPVSSRHTSIALSPSRRDK